MGMKSNRWSRDLDGNLSASPGACKVILPVRHRYWRRRRSPGSGGQHHCSNKLSQVGIVQTWGDFCPHPRDALPQQSQGPGSGCPSLAAGRVPEQKLGSSAALHLHPLLEVVVGGMVVVATERQHQTPGAGGTSGKTPETHTHPQCPLPLLPPLQPVPAHPPRRRLSAPLGNCQPLGQGWLGRWKCCFGSHYWGRRCNPHHHHCHPPAPAGPGSTVQGRRSPTPQSLLKHGDLQESQQML